MAAWKLALAGDTMLGRGVADAMRSRAPASLVAEEVVDVLREADAVVLNLECCISERGSMWPDPAKPFFFRAPPDAVELLVHLGVDCVTLANNHALDYGEEALVDTFEHLRAAGIAWAGAGVDEREARRAVVLDAAGVRLAVVGVTDHPAAYAARADRPGVAFADLWQRPVPDWLLALIRAAPADAVVATPHWGPNMTAEPVPHVRTAARALVDAGASLVAGHSAHVFHGVRGRVLFDLGDFLDDYAVDRVLRNDLGLLWLVTFEAAEAVRVEALPLKLEYCYTRAADGEDADWIRRRFRKACARLGTEVVEDGARLVVDPSREPAEHDPEERVPD